MQSLESCLHLPPDKSLLTFQREVSRRGRLNESVCFPPVQFRRNCTTWQPCFLYWLSCLFVFCFFYFYGLFARWYIVFDVCIFNKKKTKKDDYICVLLVPSSGSFGWTCLSAVLFLDRGFLALLLVHLDPLETLPSSLKGQHTSIRVLRSSFSW